MRRAGKPPGLGGPYPGKDYFALQGIGSALVTNVVLLGPALFLLKRWQPPFGTFTVLFTVVAGLMNVITGFSTAVTILPALVGGLAADVLTRRLRPSVTHPGALTTVAVLVPAALWTAYYLTLAVAYGLTWDIELPTGLIILNCLAGFALARLMLPVRGVERSTP